MIWARARNTFPLRQSNLEITNEVYILSCMFVAKWFTLRDKLKWPIFLFFFSLCVLVEILII